MYQNAETVGIRFQVEKDRSIPGCEVSWAVSWPKTSSKMTLK
jgi:hypothetical protein